MRRLLAVCFIVTLVFAGCTSTANVSSLEMSIVFNEEIPEEQMSSLYIPSFLRVIKFDGKNVNWQSKPFQSWIRVGVPSGEFTLVIDNAINSDGSKSTTHRNVTNLSFTQKFEAGKGYRFGYMPDGSTGIVEVE